MTRYAVCSDVHEDFEAFKKFLTVAKVNSADHVIVAGDLGKIHDTKKGLEAFCQDGDAERYLTGCREQHTNVLSKYKTLLDGARISYSVIPGNYDSSLSKVFGNKDLHLKKTKVNQATLAGYGGADAFPPHILPHVHLESIVKFNHEELYKAMLKAKPDIAVIHNPPQGILDKTSTGKHVGTEGAIAYLQDAFNRGIAPKLYVCGHIHEARGVKAIEANNQRTVVVNCGNLGREGPIDFRTLKTVQPGETYGTFALIDTEDDGTVRKVLQCSIGNDDPRQPIVDPTVITQNVF